MFSHTPDTPDGAFHAEVKKANRLFYSVRGKPTAEQGLTASDRQGVTIKELTATLRSCAGGPRAARCWCRPFPAWAALWGPPHQGQAGGSGCSSGGGGGGGEGGDAHTARSQRNGTAFPVRKPWEEPPHHRYFQSRHLLHKVVQDLNSGTWEAKLKTLVTL